MKVEIANVIIDITTDALNRTFSYIIPPHLSDQIEGGSVVRVPFGAKNTLREAYVIEKGYLTKEPEYTLKAIESVIDRVTIEKELIQLAGWMQRRYVCPITSALSLMVPSNVEAKTKALRSIYLEQGNRDRIQEYLATPMRTKREEKRRMILESLLDEATQLGVTQWREKDVLSRYATSTDMMKRLEKEGYLVRGYQEVGRKIAVLKQRESIAPPKELTDEQEQVVQSIVADLSHQTHLIHGVTGSGKTEIYMQLIERVLLQGKQAIVLIPEIGLTRQTIHRFIERFGPVVGVMHSRLNEGERYEQWQKAKEGSTKIMIGARSAIFTPFQHLGMVIIDEEHEHTYKSEQSPRYHTREVAIKRGMYHDCPVILGSATPLVESYHKALEGQYRLHQLKHRAIHGSIRKVECVDMRQELENGNRSIISKPLHEGIVKALNNGNQVMLFINRRGYANFISCRQCGFVYECDACEVSMTYHATNKRLICHYCGKSQKIDKTCPKCGSTYLKAFGAGTQRIVKELQRLYPSAKIGRMDQDTTRQKDGHDRILSQMENREIDILIGTQMITKGHDFHHVAVVGVLAADLSLHMDDFRASEKTYQLLTQVIGRTGRGDIEGKAYVQTYTPGHYAITTAMQEDYLAFYKEEILYRSMMVYPPFCHLLQILVLDSNESLCVQFVEEAKDYIEATYDGVDVLGPAKASVGKVNGVYRYRLLVKGKQYKQLTKVMRELYNKSGKIKCIMDMNPMSLI